MFDEPELHVVQFPQSEERRDELDRTRREGRERYLGRLADAMPIIEAIEDGRARAEAVLDHLFDHRRLEDDEPCLCSCHPRLPASDLHDYGFACGCRLTAEERRERWNSWRAELDAYWESPEGQACRAARRLEEDQLTAWLIAHPDVVVTQYGGACPEQWRGSVAGHSFYFRERHDEWRIELDLRPSGRHSRVWTGGDLSDESSFEAREIEVGEVIAEGTTGIEGYGRTAVERAEFITGIIREHLARESCAVHTVEREELEERMGQRFAWCPACGEKLPRA